jgi:hypothetical protein
VLSIVANMFKALPQGLPFNVRVFSADDASAAEREAAASRFSAALIDTLGDAALVLPVHAAYQRLAQTYGDQQRPWPLSADEQLVADQWEAAELAATLAAFGENRYLGDADFELRANF